MSTLATGPGRPAPRVADHATPVAALDEVVPPPEDRTDPVVLAVAAVPDPVFGP